MRSTMGCAPFERNAMHPAMLSGHKCSAVQVRVHSNAVRVHSNAIRQKGKETTRVHREDTGALPLLLLESSRAHAVWGCVWCGGVVGGGRVVTTDRVQVVAPSSVFAAVDGNLLNVHTGCTPVQPRSLTVHTGPSICARVRSIDNSRFAHTSA